MSVENVDCLFRGDDSQTRIRKCQKKKKICQLSRHHPPGGGATTKVKPEGVWIKSSCSYQNRHFSAVQFSVKCSGKGRLSASHKHTPLWQPPITVVWNGYIYKKKKNLLMKMIFSTAEWSRHRLKKASQLHHRVLLRQKNVNEFLEQSINTADKERGRNGLQIYGGGGGGGPGAQWISPPASHTHTLAFTV